MASTLKEWKNKDVVVVTSDGRIICGELMGYDQVQNLILQDANEHVYTDHSLEVERVPLGLYVIRGDNLCMISYPVDKFLQQLEPQQQGENDNNNDPEEQQQPFVPLKPIQQQQF